MWSEVLIQVKYSGKKCTLNGQYSYTIEVLLWCKYSLIYLSTILQSTRNAEYLRHCQIMKTSRPVPYCWAVFKCRASGKHTFLLRLWRSIISANVRGLSVHVYILQAVMATAIWIHLSLTLVYFMFMCWHHLEEL